MKATQMVALAAMLTAATAMAQDKPAQPSTPAAERQICKDEKVTGSRLASRHICMTAREWQALYSRTRENLDKFTQDSGKPVKAVSPFGE